MKYNCICEDCSNTWAQTTAEGRMFNGGMKCPSCGSDAWHIENNEV